MRLATLDLLGIGVVCAAAGRLRHAAYYAPTALGTTAKSVRESVTTGPFRGCGSHGMKSATLRLIAGHAVKHSNGDRGKQFNSQRFPSRVVIRENFVGDKLPGLMMPAFGHAAIDGGEDASG